MDFSLYVKKSDDFDSTNVIDGTAIETAVPFFIVRDIFVSRFPSALQLTFISDSPEPADGMSSSTETASSRTISPAAESTV